MKQSVMNLPPHRKSVCNLQHFSQRDANFAWQRDRHNRTLVSLALQLSNHTYAYFHVYGSFTQELVNSGRLCNESVPFQHVEPKFETWGIVYVCFSCRCNECVITGYTVVNE